MQSLGLKLVGASVALMVAACSGPAVDRAAAGSDWIGVGGAAGEAHYSGLDTIDAKTVAGLGLAWSLDLPGEHALEATPVAVDGTLYFSGQQGSVYSVDAASGTLNWKYDPEVWKHRPHHMQLAFPVNRGVAVDNEKVFVGTMDGRLIALDAKNGRVRWSVKTVADDSNQFITGAPRTFNGKVVIGNGGGDYGARGYVTAYDVDSGRQLWRFFTVPGDPAKGFEDPALAMAAKTWSGEWWKTGTGGTVWDSMVFDPESNRLFIGTGNAGPWNPRVRNPGNGDNLFLASVVALDGDTGRYIWHYQVNPNDSWDFKATAPMILATLPIEGKARKVLMQAPTNGFFYVLDRDSGRLISAEKFGKATWAERIDLKTGRPVELPGIRYEDGPTTFWPSPYGAHSWQAMAFSPRTGLVYIPYMQLGARISTDQTFMKDKDKLLASGKPLFGAGTIVEAAPLGEGDGTGALIAWDPVAQKARWRVDHPTFWNGGAMATAGDLVFQGDASGYFSAYDARTGKRLWRFNAGLGIVGAPISYTVEGTQYVSVLVGFGGATNSLSQFFRHGWKYGLQPRRLLTFRLNGKTALPTTPPPDFSVAAVDDPALRIDEALVAEGVILYNKNCAICHGSNFSSSGVPGPDLRESGVALSRDAFAELLRTGALMPQGMPRFEQLSERETRALHMAIRAAAREALGKRKPAAQNQSTGRM